MLVLFCLAFVGMMGATDQLPDGIVRFEFYVGKDPVLAELDTLIEGGWIRVAVLSTSPFWASRGLLPQREEYLGIAERGSEPADLVLLKALDWAEIEAAAVKSRSPGFHEPVFRVTRRFGGLRCEYQFTRDEYRKKGSYIEGLYVKVIEQYAHYVDESILRKLPEVKK